jgi:hypothetical protein
LPSLCDTAGEIREDTSYDKRKLSKRFIIVFTVIILVISALLILNSVMPPKFFHGDYPYYPKVADIVNAADAIIVGDVIKAREVKQLMVDVTPNKPEKETIPYTLATVKVTEVIKGTVKIGDEIVIKQLGDYKNKPEQTLYEMDGYLKENSTELMFLCEYDNSPYSPVNPAQGIVSVKSDGSLYSSNRYSLFGYNETGRETDKIDSSIITIKSYVNANY